MQQFIKKVEKGPYEVEMLIDGKVFNDRIILKAMYELVDKVYMFVKTKGNDYVVQFKLKPHIKEKLDDVVNTFGEELVYHRLRYDIDRKYGKLREKIIEIALGFGLSLDDIKKDINEMMEKIKSLSLNETQQQGFQEVGSNSIDDIIKEIENDPDFADDKDEIINVLREIEEEEEKGKEKIENS